MPKFSLYLSAMDSTPVEQGPSNAAKDAKMNALIMKRALALSKLE
jgi:hypothetical protein